MTRYSVLLHATASTWDSPDAVAEAALKLKVLGTGVIALMIVGAVLFRWGWPWPLRDGFRRRTPEK